MKANNPQMTQAQIELIMKQTDVNASGGIDRKEFMEVLLPQMKMEMLTFNTNFEELRRLFKEFDSDQSNYLNKEELRAALVTLNITLTDIQMEDLMKEIDLDSNQMIDIDEFIAYLSIADQIKIRNPQTKSTIVKIKQGRKMQAIDFYNCFKNLPQFFQPSVTQDNLEKQGKFTPSSGFYPEFDSKTLQYKDLQKLEDVSKPTFNSKKYTEVYQPQLGCEIILEEITGIPLPKKEDFDWSKITNRELRAVLVDFRTQEFLSNVFVVSASWKQEYSNKWMFNTNDS